MADKITKDKVYIGRYSFSKLRLLIFTLVFALLAGGYLVYQSFAAVGQGK